MSMNELNSTARDLMSVRQMIEELQAEAEALTDKLKAAMVEQGAEVLQGDGWKATWKNVSSSRFDSKSFKADHADLYGHCRRRQADGRGPQGAESWGGCRQDQTGLHRAVCHPQTGLPQYHRGVPDLGAGS